MADDSTETLLLFGVAIGMYFVIKSATKTIEDKASEIAASLSPSNLIQGASEAASAAGQAIQTGVQAVGQAAEQTLPLIPFVTSPATAILMALGWATTTCVNPDGSTFFVLGGPDNCPDPATPLGPTVPTQASH